MDKYILSGIVDELVKDNKYGEWYKADEADETIMGIVEERKELIESQEAYIQGLEKDIKRERKDHDHTNEYRLTYMREFDKANARIQELEKDAKETNEVINRHKDIIQNDIFYIDKLRKALEEIANAKEDRNYTGYMRRIATEALKEGEDG